MATSTGTPCVPKKSRAPVAHARVDGYLRPQTAFGTTRTTNALSRRDFTYAATSLGCKKLVGNEYPLITGKLPPSSGTLRTRSSVNNVVFYTITRLRLWGLVETIGRLDHRHRTVRFYHHGSSVGPCRSSISFVGYSGSTLIRF
jgi:hypothetical protein